MMNKFIQIEMAPLPVDAAAFFIRRQTFYWINMFLASPSGKMCRDYVDALQMNFGLFGHHFVAQHILCCFTK